MSNKTILWCNDGKHDKVWGIILLAEQVQLSEAWPFKTNKYVTFWGRRGAKLQTKEWNGSGGDAYELARQKMKKGYEEVDERYLDEVYPEFQQDLEKTELWAKLKM